ncbi:RAP protein, putative [Plasmodium malariae]|uniref:RAP protein, putative n=3 Tax=Plasmodium (Plasmodium) TaxID=418103 RepID=A0A1D3PCN5_PLAMA|nr:RAP protein, putative [Plasmodium malariae]SCN12755.1 RAP protein, putative [Plasmodium malariae]
MFFTNVRFISKLMKIKISKRKSWIKRKKKWMLPKIEKSYLKQEQDFTVPHKTIPLNENKKYEANRNNNNSNYSNDGKYSKDSYNNENTKNIDSEETGYNRMLEELKGKGKKNLKPHEYKKLLKKKEHIPKNDDKISLRHLLQKGRKNVNLDIRDFKEEEKEKKKKELNTFWYMPNPFEKKGVYGMKENSFYKSFIRDRERQLDNVDVKKLNENERKLLNDINKKKNSNYNNNNRVNEELLDKSVSLEETEEKEKKIRISPRKYWFHKDYFSPDISTLNTVRARELRFLMMNEAKLVRKGKTVDLELWLAFMNRVITLSTKVHVRSLLRYLQTIASVKVTNKKMINDILCEIFNRENNMKPKHYVYLFQSCSRLKWNDFKLIYALKNMTLCWSILRNNFLIKSANSISKLDLANIVYSKALQITLQERLGNFTGKELRAIKAITFLEFFNEEMIIKFISLATFYKEYFNYYTRHLQILYLYIMLFHTSIYNKLTEEQREFLQRYSRESNLKKINKINHKNYLNSLRRKERTVRGCLRSDDNDCSGSHYPCSDYSSTDDEGCSDSDYEGCSDSDDAGCSDSNDEGYSDGNSSSNDKDIYSGNVGDDDDEIVEDGVKFYNKPNIMNNTSRNLKEKVQIDGKNSEHIKLGDKICGGYTSMLHKEVSDLLTILKIEHLNSVKCGPFMVDIYHPESNYIIELNAHFQYYLNSENLTALSKWRHKFLFQMGYKVIHIPYRTWNNIPNDNQKIDYICSVLPNIVLASSPVYSHMGNF